jgi:hypothetical protein
MNSVRNRLAELAHSLDQHLLALKIRKQNSKPTVKILQLPKLEIDF